MLNRIQQEHIEWSRSRFGYTTPDQMLIGIVEEVGELAHSHLKLSQGIRTDEDHEGKIADALGDIVIFLIAYCNVTGFNLEDVVQTTWNHVRKRDWKENPVNGKVPDKDSSQA